jgi:SAM-dependent methyltransferase
MSEADRERWDERYRGGEMMAGPLPKPLVLELEPVLPRQGRALDIACGEGQLAIWLAQRGLSVTALDISPVALARLRATAAAQGHAARIEAIEADLDEGLPRLRPGFDLVTCVDFYSPAVIDQARALLAPRGILLVQVLLQQPGGASAHRALPGEALGLARGLRLQFYREGLRGGRALAQLLAQREPAESLPFSD